MKLKVFLSLLTIGFIFLSINKVTAQSLAPNTFILQPYVGAPNMKKWVYDQDYKEGNSSKGFGHVGMGGELTVSSRFGVGFDAIYSPFSRTEENSHSIYNESTGLYDNVLDKREFKEDQLRLLAKVYIHFNIDNPQWDIYISGGLGANIVFTKAYINGEKVNYEQNFMNSSESPILRVPFPFSGRFCFGTRYFFSDYFGINFEAGVGGPPFSVGMNVRF